MQVRAEADFRNQAFLNRFITELGRLPPKRVTRLQQKTHRHLCRTIKVRNPWFLGVYTAAGLQTACVLVRTPAV